MFIFLVLTLLAVPVVELYLIVKVASGMGVLNTFGLLIFISVVGAWMVRREGLGILRKAQNEIAAGRLPSRQLIDGLFVLSGAVLMLTPGFATDAFGFALLIPPTRSLFRGWVIKWFTRRISVRRQEFTDGIKFGEWGHNSSQGFGNSSVSELESRGEDEPPRYSPLD